MNRDSAISLIREKVKNKNLIKHMLATESIMAALAVHFGEDANLWGLAGLVHDIDYDLTLNDPDQHGRLGARMLEEAGADPVIIQAVKAHGPAYGQPRLSRIDTSLFAADPLSGLIVAAALVHPQKKLAVLDTSFILKRFQEKWFAKGANREQILACEQVELKLDEFIDLGLKAMQGISGELGL
ncbi:MAG: HDIG domain-containing metalloprotein [bacterium]